VTVKGTPASVTSTHSGSRARKAGPSLFPQHATSSTLLGWEGVVA
jgi:hypothetical protein